MPNRFAAIPMALAALFCCGAVATTELPHFTEIAACRVDEQRVLLRGTFDGGACQRVQPLSYTAAHGTSVTVVVGTERTAEICTMQIAPVSFEQAFHAPEPVFDIDVTVFDPDNNPVAYDMVSLDETGADCTAPGE